MPRWLKIVLRVAVTLVLIVVVAWTALVLYIQTNKRQVLNYVTEQLSEQMSGSLMIKDMEPSFWRGFPDVSVALKEVSLQDSMYAQHRHSLLYVKTVYIQMNPWHLLHKKAAIKKIIASDGQLYLYTDSTGYSNTYLLRKKDTNSTSKSKLDCRNYALENVTVVLEEQVKHKLFRIEVKEANGFARQDNGIWYATTQLRAHIGSMMFNVEKGSFLKDRDLETVLKTKYDPATKEFSLDKQQIDISGYPIQLTAQFSFINKPAAFKLHIHSTKVPFDTAVTWLSHNISRKIDSIHIIKPMSMDAYLDGRIKFRDTPDVRVVWRTKDNEMQTPFANFTHCDFDGIFFNNVLPDKGHTDMNTMVALRHVKAEWSRIPFSADSIRVDNLLYPRLKLALASRFSLPNINNVSDKIPFLFKDGEADLKLSYSGGVKSDDTLYPNIEGHLNIKRGVVEYLPRGFNFRISNGNLVFHEDNLFLNNISLQGPNSAVSLKGFALHFFRFYFNSPDKVLINCQAAGKDLDISDLLVFVGKRKQQKARTVTGGSRSSARMLNQLSNVLDACEVQLQLAFDKIHYHKFLASGFSAKAKLLQSEISLPEVKLSHANGSIFFAATINQDATGNPFKLKSRINNVAVDQLLYAFDNFGQTTISNNNIQGSISADVDITGNITEGGSIVKRSLNGTVGFTVENGALLNFEPLQKISKFLFRNRDMSHIIFKNVSNRLEVNGNKIVIPSMNIASSALYMKVQGIYSLSNGTDIAIEIPLRNPKKDGFDTTGISYPKMPDKKGLVLYLRAKDGDDGKVKINWDPLKYGVKATKDSLRMQ